MKTNMGDGKYKNWDNPVAIAFDKVGRMGIQYKDEPCKRCDKLNHKIKGLLMELGLHHMEKHKHDKLVNNIPVGRVLKNKRSTGESRQKSKYLGKSKKLMVAHDDITHPLVDEWKCKECKRIRKEFEKEFVK